MTQREKQHPDKNGGYSKTIQIEVRLEKRGPVIKNGEEGSLKTIPSKYIIKRQELRSQIEIRKRYRLYFRLMKDAYGKAHVIDLDRIDDGPKVAARPSALGLERIRDRRIHNRPYEPAGKDKSSQQEVPPLPAPELPLPEPSRDCTDQDAPSAVVGELAHDGLALGGGVRDPAGALPEGHAQPRAPVRHGPTLQHLHDRPGGEASDLGGVHGDVRARERSGEDSNLDHPLPRRRRDRR